MVDPGEGVTTTLVRWMLYVISSSYMPDVFLREFMEEALDSTETGSNQVNRHT